MTGACGPESGLDRNPSDLIADVARAEVRAELEAMAGAGEDPEQARARSKLERLTSSEDADSDHGLKMTSSLSQKLHHHSCRQAVL